MSEAFEPIENSAGQVYGSPSNDVGPKASTATGSDQWTAMGPSGQSVKVEAASASMITSAPWIPAFSPALKPLRSLPSASLSYDVASTAKPVSEAYRIVNELSGGRVIIPREVREALGIKPGESLRLTVEGNKMVLTRSMSPEEFLKKKGVIKEGSPLPLTDPLSMKKIWEAP